MAAREVEDGEVGDQAVDHAAPVSGSVHSRLTVTRRFGAVLHDHDDALGAVDEVHRPAHPLDHLAGDHPVGEIAVLGDLHAAEDREIDVPAADHRERLGAVEERGAGHGGDRLLAGVDQVRILLARPRDRDRCRAARSLTAASRSA
jgi:hypothetical protein